MSVSVCRCLSLPVSVSDCFCLSQSFSVSLSLFDEASYVQFFDLSKDVSNLAQNETITLMFWLSSNLTGASVSASVKISHLARFFCARAQINAFWNSVRPNFLKEKKVPENDWRIPLTFSYIGAMKIIQSVIHGSNYYNTCNYESIHVRKRIFDHFSRFQLSTLHFVFLLTLVYQTLGNQKRLNDIHPWSIYMYI